MRGRAPNPWRRKHRGDGKGWRAQCGACGHLWRLTSKRLEELGLRRIRSVVCRVCETRGQLKRIGRTRYEREARTLDELQRRRSELPSTLQRMR